MNTETRIARIARWHVSFGLAFAVLGMALGIYMSATGIHAQHVTHAHALLLGFVVSVVYAAIYRLWLGAASPRVAAVQTGLHQAGTVLIIVGLLAMFSGSLTEDALGPVLGGGSFAAIASATMMLYQFALSGRSQPAAPGGTVGASSS